MDKISLSRWWFIADIIKFYREGFCGVIKYKKSERKVDFIKDLKNTSDISEMCHRSDESIYVIKNGYGDMVIMSMESYESQMKRIKIYEYIGRRSWPIWTRGSWRIPSSGVCPSMICFRFIWIPSNWQKIQGRITAECGTVWWKMARSFRGNGVVSHFWSKLKNCTPPRKPVKSSFFGLSKKLKKISTQGLTVLTVSAIVQLEQRKRKRNLSELWKCR